MQISSEEGIGTHAENVLEKLMEHPDVARDVKQVTAATTRCWLLLFMVILISRYEFTCTTTFKSCTYANGSAYNFEVSRNELFL